MYISPPCRAVIVVANAIGLVLEIKELYLFQAVEDYSHAIITYICNKYDKEDKLYPKDFVFILVAGIYTYP